MTAAQSPMWGPPPAQQPQPPPNFGQAVPQGAPQQWGPPPPNMQPPPPQWGGHQHQAPGVPQQMPQAAGPQAIGYGAPPQWGAPAPIAAVPVWGQAAPQQAAPEVAPGWGQQMAPAPTPGAAPGWGPVAPIPTPEAVVPLRPTAPEPASVPVVPTTASAVMAPLEADKIPPNAPRTLAAFLITFDADPLGQFWQVHQGQNIVGRKGSGAELHLEIDHPTTSSRHATIHAAARPGRLKVEDLGSTNGTYVNERRIEPGERRPLETGDTLRFGGFSVTVILV